MAAEGAEPAEQERRHLLVQIAVLDPFLHAGTSIEAPIVDPRPAHAGSFGADEVQENIDDVFGEIDDRHEDRASGDIRYIAIRSDVNRKIAGVVIEPMVEHFHFAFLSPGDELVRRHPAFAEKEWIVVVGTLEEIGALVIDEE